MRLYTHTVEHLEALPLTTSIRSRYKGDNEYGGHVLKRKPSRKWHTRYRAPGFLDKYIGSPFEHVLKKAKEQGITKTELWFFLEAEHRLSYYFFDENQCLREISEPPYSYKTVVPKKNTVFTLEIPQKGKAKKITYTDKTWDSKLIPERKSKRAFNTTPDINTLKVIKGEVVVCNSKKAPALRRFHAERSKKEKIKEKQKRKAVENKSLQALDSIRKSTKQVNPKKATKTLLQSWDRNPVDHFVLGNKVIFRVYPVELISVERGCKALPWYGFVSSLKKQKETLKVLKNLGEPYKWKYCIVGDNLDGYLKYKKRVDLKATDFIISGFTKFSKVISSPLKLLLSDEAIKAHYTEKKLKKMKHAVHTRKDRSQNY